MKIAVFGLGYVGSVTGACLAQRGHTVCGVDVSAEKVRLINAGAPPVLEKGMDRLVRAGVDAGRLRATTDTRDAVETSDLSLVCVGTPSLPDGKADLSHVIHAMGGIGHAMRQNRRYHTVALRSTVPPGTVESVVMPILERASRKRAEVGFGICFHPEFLREGSSVSDFFHPPKTVIGAAGPRSARALLNLWQPIAAPLFITSLRVAEMAKYVDNAFHALKVAFANEVGSVAKALGVDGHEVMEIFTSDRKLNLSPLYFRPGFAFGGPCLPKDLRALCAIGRAAGVETPLLSGVLTSNTAHLRRSLELVLAAGTKRIGVLGLVFKAGTDDLRESPVCALVKRLLESGMTVRILEPRVDPGRLIGTNRAFVQNELPNLKKLLVPSVDDLLRVSDVLVITGNHPQFDDAIQKMNRRQILIDLVRIAPPLQAKLRRIEGICW